MTLQEAKTYIHYAIKGGFYDPEQFDGWTDQQLIDFATSEGARGDLYADYLQALAYE